MCIKYSTRTRPCPATGPAPGPATGPGTARRRGRAVLGLALAFGLAAGAWPAPGAGVPGPSRAFAQSTPATATEAAADPVRTVEALHAALLDVMQRASLLGRSGRAARLAPALEAAYDLPFMARTASGAAWKGMDAPTQARIVEAFRAYTVATYADRFDGWSGERFETVGAPSATAQGTRVETRIVGETAAPVRLDYLLRESGGAWRIVDVYLTGTISELATRRAEFTAILRRGGPEELIRTLERQATRLGEDR